MRGVAALLVALCAAPLAASESLDIQMSCPWIDLDGYTPLVVSLASHAGAGRIELDGEMGNAHARLVVDLPAETRVTRTLLVPGLAAGRGSPVLHVSGSIGGRDVAETITPSSVVHQFRDLDLAIVDPHEDFPLSDARTTAKAQLHASSGSPKSGYGYRGSGASYADSRLDRVPVEALPDRWQGYPTWLALLVTPAGDGELSAEQRAAIAVWCGAGGAVFVTDERQLPAWRAAGATATVVGATSPALFARIEAVGAAASFAPTRWSVPGTERAHVLGFVVLAVLFAVLVGPINIWWVRRRNALHLFLITTPLISLATCVSLVVVGYLAEGLGLRRSVTQFAILDQTHGRVTAWTGASYFSGLSVTRLPLDAEDKMLTMDPGDFSQQSYYRGTAPLTVDWGDGQRFSGSAIPARVNRQLAFVSARPEKRRLILERDGAGWKITNGLGSPIKELVWFDSTAASWRCGALAAGTTARLTAQVWSPPPKPERSDRIGGDSALAWSALLPETGATNVFYAKLDGAFLAIPGPSGSDADNPATELIGPLAAAAAEGTP